MHSCVDEHEAIIIQIAVHNRFICHQVGGEGGTFFYIYYVIEEAIVQTGNSASQFCFKRSASAITSIKASVFGSTYADCTLKRTQNFCLRRHSSSYIELRDGVGSSIAPHSYINRNQRQQKSTPPARFPFFS